MGKTLVCAIYNHPEAYPPTLNAIQELSKIYSKIYLLYQYNLDDLWEYPSNVVLKRNAKKKSVAEQIRLPYFKKIALFLSFTWRFFKVCIKQKPDCILLYDSVPVLSYHISRKLFRFRHKTWYHNHDVVEKGALKKYSITWWAGKAETSSFKYLNIFSLPSNERRKYFPLTDFKGQYFYIPNFPLISFYDKCPKSNPPSDTLTLIYQGSISAGHGIEAVMNYIKESSKKVNLLLIGNIDNEYRNNIQTLSSGLGIEHRIEIQKPVNYSCLPPITASAHVGLALHIPNTNIIYSTGGTASNKIYEYAAVGLPVLYYDSDHYNTYLAKFKWAFGNDLTFGQFDSQLEYITAHYNTLSGLAQDDFHNELNFEKQFEPVLLFLENLN
ncbi:MAG: hypothetical protein JST47_04175 [Bacteroidetes bacterium]|nr:hypothetical protein [Bacteroidota bacterium]MBS1974636.1 hypothetical protein [Bacteroidota bacterium]